MISMQTAVATSETTRSTTTQQSNAMSRRPVSRLMCVLLLFVLGTLPASQADAVITFLNKWGSSGSGDGQFTGPAGVAVNPSGDVYVADTLNHRIQKFTGDGTFLTKWGSFGSGDGQFWNPNDVAVNPSGEVYVADTENHRIQKFTGDGTFQTKWGSFGIGDGQFGFPAAVAVSTSGEVYVAGGGNRVQKFASDGTFQTKWGSFGSGDGQFWNPKAVAVSATAEVYVADQGNNRIQKFTGDGTFQTKWGSSGSGDGQFAGPAGVAVSTSGEVYVADVGNNRIQKFASDGTFLTEWGSSGSGDGQFSTPNYVAVSATGVVYVTEFGNSRVQRFFDTDAWVSGTNTFVDAAVGSAQLLGPTQIIGIAKGLNVGGTTTINADGRLDLIGDASLFSTGDLENAGLLNVLTSTIDVGTGLTNTGDSVFVGTTVTGPVISPAGSAINVVGSVTFEDLVSGAGGIFGSGTATFNGGHSPGDSPAIVTIEDSVAYGSSNTLSLELGGLIAGEFDQLDIGGDAFIDGLLDVTLLGPFDLSIGQQFLVMDIDGTATGQFIGFGEGDLVGNFGGEDLFISYLGGDGNDVLLFSTPVPEPATVVMGAFALCGLGVIGWRRRRAG